MLRQLPLWALLGVAAATGFIGAAGRQATFASRVDLVRVPVTVLDAQGRSVRSLVREDFSVFEDNVRQPIQVFTDQNIPLSAGLLVDTSVSMRGQRIADAAGALRLFIREALATGDDAFVMQFGGAPQIVQGWTEKTALEQTRLALQIKNGTPMFQAIALGVEHMASARHVRRVILLITDGNATDDWPSRWTKTNWPYRARIGLERSETMLYAIGIDSPPPGSADPLSAKSADITTLRRFTDNTGGYTEVVRSSGDLALAVQQISEELKQQYLIGYASTKARDGRVHALRVEVRVPTNRVRARKVFLAQESRR